MGLKTEKWSIAFRQKTEYTDTQTPYRKLTGCADGWYADPFLFEKDGKTYLFAEFMSYKTVRGSLAYCEYDEQKNSFGDWREVIAEPFHMSYPFIFEYENEVYILPETAEARALYLYRASSFPDKWERTRVFFEGKALADTTLLPDGKRAVSYEISEDKAARSLVLDLDDRRIALDITAMRPVAQSRPGGKCFLQDDKWILPTQDCSSTYGGALIFYSADPKLASFTSVLTVKPTDFTVIDERARICGVHTYNSSRLLEVIDYKTYTVSPNRIYNRILQKAGLR